VLTDVILYHHTPEKAAVSPELVHLVYLADLIISRFAVGQEMERLGTKALPDRLGILGLTSDRFPAVVEKLHKLIMEPLPQISG